MANNFYASLQNYAEQISTKEPALLARLREETQSLPGSQMISSPLQGRALSLLAQLLSPKKILEIGTYTGYSALCLSEGLSQKGLLYTIDRNKEVVAIAKRYAQQARKAHQIHFYTGNALALVSTIPGPFDLVFIDADKKNYTHYYDLVIPNLRPGGLIIADNVFWSGKVWDEAQLTTCATTRALYDFAQKIKTDTRVAQVTLPIRDGLLVAKKH
ncbi:MAG: O-methyltransferase [Bacteroidota bacterium]